MCQTLQKQHPQDKFRRTNRMGTAFHNQQQRQPSWCKAESLERGRNDVHRRGERRPGLSLEERTTANQGFPFLFLSSSFPRTCGHAGVTLCFARFGSASSTLYHDNPGQSHARTQCATSFSSPPRVRASTKYLCPLVLSCHAPATVLHGCCSSQWCYLPGFVVEC